jgi:hypothetical protein
MFELCSVVLIKSEVLTEDTEIGVFCFGIGDVLVVTPNENFTTVDDVVEESTSFMCSE